MSYHVLQSYPEQIVFVRKPGMTKDLRSHAKVYALRSNVKWSVKDKKQFSRYWHHPNKALHFAARSASKRETHIKHRADTEDDS